MTKRVIFARTGYMRYYAGPQKGDEKPKYGGSYTAKNIGHEAYNFKSAMGWVYGFFTPSLRKGKPITINLERIEEGNIGLNKLDNVLVIFVARKGSVGQVVIGWYDDATVFRECQKSQTEMLRKNYFFLIKARAEKAVLLPEKYRAHPIPKGLGAFGRASVVYPLESDRTPRVLRSGKFKWMKDAIDYVSSYDGPNLLTNPFDNLEDLVAEMAENEKNMRTGQRFQIDPKMRKQIEMYAVNCAKKYFIKQKYAVEYVGHVRSYDLRCTKGNNILHVEVKGTQADGSSLILTPNEVSNAIQNKAALYVLHSIRWRRAGKHNKPYGGTEIILNPWNVNKHGHLQALSYAYEIK
ncbi:MAG: DUF3883 domain-containing protein [Thermodesulfovibrionales bacterium]